jgi:hypothetical protein
MHSEDSDHNNLCVSGDSPKEIVCFVALNTHGGHACNLNNTGRELDTFTTDSQTNIDIFSNVSIGNDNYGFQGNEYIETLKTLNDYIHSSPEIDIHKIIQILLKRKMETKQSIRAHSSQPINEWSLQKREFIKDPYLYYQHIDSTTGPAPNKLYTFNRTIDNMGVYLLSTFTKQKYQQKYNMEFLNRNITNSLPTRQDGDNIYIYLDEMINGIKEILPIPIQPCDKLTIIFIDDACDTLMYPESHSCKISNNNSRCKRALTRAYKVKVPGVGKLNYQKLKLPSIKRGGKKHKRLRTQKHRKR